MPAAKILTISICSAFMLAACGKPEEADTFPSEPMIEPLAPVGWADAMAAFVDTNGAPAGFAALVNAPAGGVLLRLDVKGLSQGWHGIHLHQVGDCSDHADGFKASGGHINPDQRQHGLLNPEGPDRADMPNIYAGADGRATAEIFTSMVALSPSEAADAADAYPIIDDDGFAIVIHANTDDHVTQPIGNAGARVACAVISANE